MEIVSMDSLIIKIMSYAQKLVNADRASLFLVDPKSNQLYARLFDVTDHNENPAASALQDINKEVRSVAAKLRGMYHRVRNMYTPKSYL